MDEALSRHFKITLSELDSVFQEELRRQNVPPGVMDDLRLTIELYDTVRRYQQLLDPSAYFLTPWLLDTREMRNKGITADYLRRPGDTANLTLETMLTHAGYLLYTGQHTQVERLVSAVNVVLGAIEEAIPDPFEGDTLAFDYHEIVILLKDSWPLYQPLSKGQIQPQRIQVDGDRAVAWVSIKSLTLKEVRLKRDAQGWHVLSPWEIGSYGQVTINPKMISKGGVQYRLLLSKK
jgi:hypothetical protein